jgi:hypothetical protein
MSTISASTTSTTAFKVTADTTGALVIQTGATPTTAVTVSSAQVVTLANALAEASGGTGTTVGYNGFKNRIINGAIGIWQRGTSFTSGGTATYTADRFYGNGSSGTISRSTDVPAGFTYSFSNATSSTAFPGITQRIESVNIADCASQAITVSFYVKQTSGTASALNINLAYPSAVDNWGSSTTIVETNVVATMPSSWTRYSYTYILPANVTNGLSATLFIPSGSVTATFLITGVQLEKGSTATSFDYRPYGTELQLCYRYYYFLGGETAYQNINTCVWYGAGDAVGQFSYPVAMRANPTMAKTGTWATLGGGGAVAQTLSNDQITTKNVQLGFTGGSGGTSGQATTLRASNDTGFRLTFSAEL